MKHFTLSFILLAGCTTAGLRQEPHLVMNCNIFDSKGTLLRTFRGHQCQFFPDGSYVAQDRQGLTMHDHQGSVMWHLKMHTHHLLTKTDDNKLMVSSSAVHNYLGKATRFDVLHLVNLNGEIERTYDFYENRMELENIYALPGGRKPMPFDWDKEAFPEVEMEYSHANSFYQIPENPMARDIPGFAAGGFVVNVTGFRRIMIFDKDLKKVVWSSYYGGITDPPSSVLHDVQVLTNGNLLFYSNRAQENGKTFSTLNEVNPLTRKTVWRYIANPPSTFYSDVCGGVQILNNGNVLYSDITHGGEAVTITREGKELARIPYHIIDSKTNKPFKIQDAKAYDLSAFLKLNSGL